MDPVTIGLLAASFLGGVGKKKQTQTTSYQGDPAYSGLQQMMINQAMSRLQKPSALPAGYETQGIGSINRTFDTIGQGIGNRAAALGVSGGAGEQYATNMANIARGGQIAGFQTQIPLQERAMRLEDLGFANSILGSQRYGQTTTGTSGGGFGGGLENLAGMFGYLYGAGKIGGGGTGGINPVLPNNAVPPNFNWYK